MRFLQLLSDLWSNLMSLGRSGVDNIGSKASRVEGLVGQREGEVKKKRIAASQTRGSLELLKKDLIAAQESLAEADLGLQRAEEQGLTGDDMTAISDLVSEREALVTELDTQIHDLEVGLGLTKKAITEAERSVRRQRAMVPVLQVKERGAQLKRGLSGLIDGPMSTGTTAQIERTARQIEEEDAQSTAMITDSLRPDSPEALLKRLVAGDKNLSVVQRSHARRAARLGVTVELHEPHLLTAGSGTMELPAVPDKEKERRK